MLAYLNTALQTALQKNGMRLMWAFYGLTDIQHIRSSPRPAADTCWYRCASRNPLAKKCCLPVSDHHMQVVYAFATLGRCICAHGSNEQVALASCRCVGVGTVAPARCCTVHLYPPLYGIWHVKPVKGQRTVTQYEPRLRCRECNCGCCSECLAKSGLAIMNGAALRNEVPHALIGITSPMKFMERGCDCTPWVPRSSGENPSGLHKD